MLQSVLLFLLAGLFEIAADIWSGSGGETAGGASWVRWAGSSSFLMESYRPTSRRVSGGVTRRTADSLWFSSSFGDGVSITSRPIVSMSLALPYA
jgi:hypothetical protein